MRRLFKADVNAGQEAPPRQGAGDMLRAAREARGLMLPDVASMLRIRLPYLQAIEEGRYADLPGAAYVSGFLRSYAEHVGLEPDVVVRRYKEEAVGRDARQELYLPTPAAEGRMPGGALLFGALVLAGVVYGAWYYASATDRSLVDLTPALPERFVALLEGLPWRPAGSGAAGSGADGAAAPIEAPPPPIPAPAAPAVSSPAVSPPGVSPPSPPATPPFASAPPAASPSASAPSKVATVAPPPPAVAASAFQPPREEPEEEVEGSAQEPTPLAPGAGPLSPPSEAPPPAIDPTVASKVYGAANGASRIQLRATQDSWLQVRERSGEILFTRTLKPGEVYRVPDRPGLRVRTGNAGGLTVITDGVPGAPMGAVGQVLRDVPLDSPSLSGATN